MITELTYNDLETLASVEGGGCSWRGAGGTVAYGATCWWS